MLENGLLSLRSLHSVFKVVRTAFSERSFDAELAVNPIDLCFSRTAG